MVQVSPVTEFWRRALESSPEAMAGIEELRRELGYEDGDSDDGRDS